MLALVAGALAGGARCALRRGGLARRRTPRNILLSKTAGEGVRAIACGAGAIMRSGVGEKRKACADAAAAVEVLAKTGESKRRAVAVAIIDDGVPAQQEMESDRACTSGAARSPEHASNASVVDGTDMQRRTATRSREQGPERRNRTRKNAGKVRLKSAREMRKDEANDKQREELVKEIRAATVHFRDGLRHVQCYPFAFTAYAKHRWLGRSVHDVFVSEFKGHTPDSVRTAVELGRMTINGRPIGPEQVIENGDKVVNTVHRHELAVFDDPIHILHSDDELVVVSKPPSIPIHPCGRYRHNSLTHILCKDTDLGLLFPIHRIDKLTSGLVLLGRTREAADRYISLIHDGCFQKAYLALVHGRVSEERIVVDAPLLTDKKRTQKIRVDHDAGKESITVFEVIAAGTHCSLLRCLPKTGRTHQIRTHLEHIGHSIVGDPLYRSANAPPLPSTAIADPAHDTSHSGSAPPPTSATSSPSERSQCPDASLAAASLATSSELLCSSNPASSELRATTRSRDDSLRPSPETTSPRGSTSPRSLDRLLCQQTISTLEHIPQELLDPLCDTCAAPYPQILHRPGLCLHALSYESEQHSLFFSCPPPPWAAPFLRSGE